MKAFTIDCPGAPHTLTLNEVPIPEPGQFDVRVKIEAIGLNPADYKLMANGVPGWTYPFIPGLDAAGTIDAVGTGVSRWRTGDRVAFHGNLTKPGVFAEYALAASQSLALIPASISYVQAASLPCSGLTALHALRKLHLEPGHKLLILGGSGGVGSLAIQLARQAGVEVMATASATNQDYLVELGTTYPIDYEHQSILAEVRKRTADRGVEAVFDTVGYQANPAMFSWLAFDGQLVTIVDLPTLPKDFIRRSLSFQSFTLGAVYSLGSATQQASLLGSSLSTLFDYVDQGILIPQTKQVIDWSAIPAGLEQLKSGHVIGKIVATL